MLKPFYNKKKNINNRLIPPVTAADAGKVFGVDEEGNVVLVEGGDGGGSVYPEVIIKFTTTDISPVEVPGRSIIVITDPGKVIYAFLVTRESFILPANGEVNCITDLIYFSPDPINITGLVVDVSFIADLSQTFQAINGAINVAPDTYFLYDKTEISILLRSK